MHIRIFKGIRGDELMCTHVYALMWTHTHWGERIPCSFITMRPPWIEMTWQLLLMSERFASTITRTHTCTHIQHWTPAAGSPRRPHTHLLTHTRHKLSHNQDYWSLSRTRTPSAVPYGEQRRWLHVGSMGTPVATAVSSGDTPLTLTEIHRDRDRQQKERLRVRHISAAPDDFIHAFHAVDGKLSHNLSDTFLMLFIVWFMLLDLFHTVYSNNWVISTVGNRKEPVHKTTHPFSLLLYLFLSSVAPTVCFLSPSFFWDPGESPSRSLSLHSCTEWKARAPSHCRNSPVFVCVCQTVCECKKTSVHF